MDISRFSYSTEDDTEGGQEEQYGTLVTIVSGQNATRVSYPYMHSTLAGPAGFGANGVATFGRLWKPDKVVRHPQTSSPHYPLQFLPWGNPPSCGVQAKISCRARGQGPRQRNATLDVPSNECAK